MLAAGVVPGAVPEEVVKSQYADLKGVKIVRAPKARHFIMLDDPEFFMAQVKAFLGGK
jgi:pimeloyl-ACP methyl ester carboxylesterase